jgi:hypothetical protein
VAEVLDIIQMFLSQQAEVQVEMVVILAQEDHSHPLKVMMAEVMEKEQQITKAVAVAVKVLLVQVLLME